jgi:hypothetical protein
MVNKIVWQRSMLWIVAAGALLMAQTLGDPACTEIAPSARGLSMAGCGVASAEGGSALLCNPGTLVFMPGSEFAFSFGGIRLLSQATYGGAPAVPFESHVDRVGISAVSYVRGIRGQCDRLAFGVAYSNPYVLDASLEYGGTLAGEGAAGTFSNLYEARGRFDYWTSGIGYRITPDFGAGLSLRSALKKRPAARLKTP